MLNQDVVRCLPAPGDTHARKQPATQNARSRWSYGKIEDCEQSRATTRVYSYFEKGCGKKCAAKIPKGNMGYDQYTVPDDCSCGSYFYCFPLALANKFPWPFLPILSNFFEKKKTQNHPQCLSGLSRALFPTTFLEIAVCYSSLVAKSPGFN